MTINEFWRELNERENLERLRISFEYYTWIFYQENGRFMNVGIDLFQWLSQHASVEQALDRLPSGSDEFCTIISGIASKLRFMQSLPVNFVIVIDGTIKNDKLRHMDVQKSEIDYVFEDMYPIVEQQISNKGYIINGALLNKVIDYLKAANIEYIFAIGDAEIELARLNHLNVIDGIISNDADSFAYGANLVFRNFSKNKSDNPQTGKGNDQTSNVFVTPISLDLLKKHGLGTDEIMFLALCQGDDYSNGMSSLGIKKAWNLATKKLNTFDVVKDLKRIYHPENQTTKTIFSYNFEQRKAALNFYESALNDYIRDNAQTLFGQRHNTKVSLPSDYVIASHFLPYYTKHIFLASLFTGNQNSYRRDHIPLIAMSEIDWNRYGIFGKFPYSVKRGNDLHFRLGESTIVVNEIPRDKIFENNIEPLDWFSKLKYPQILDASRTTRNKLTGYDYLVDELGKCCVWKAIVCMEDLELGPDDIYIKSEKQETFEFDSKRYSFKKYQVMVKKRQIFKRYVQLRLYDDDLNPIEEKPDFVWMPDFMFKYHSSAKKLLQDYNTRKLSPKKKTPKKQKQAAQKTNLDFWSKSPKSPFKMTVKKSESLDLTGITTISVKHPNEEEQLLSPHKKSKLETEKDLDEVKAGDNSFSYVFDAETSRVLGVDSIEKVSQQPNLQPIKDLLSDLQNSELTDSTENGEIEVLVKRDKVFANSSNPVRTEHQRLAVKRGPSDLDTATRLPSVPVSQEHETNYLEKIMSEKENSDYLKDFKEIDATKASASFTEDSFTDTDGAIEAYLQQIDGTAKSKQINESNKDIETIMSDDTFSDDIDLEMIEATPKSETTLKTHIVAENIGDDDDIEIVDFAAGFNKDQKQPISSATGAEINPTDQSKAVSHLLEPSHNSSSLHDTDLSFQPPISYQDLNNTKEVYLEDLTFEDPIIVNQNLQVKKEYETNFTAEKPIIIDNNHAVIDLTLESDDEDSIEESEGIWGFKPEEGMVLAENTDDEELFISMG